MTALLSMLRRAFDSRVAVRRDGNIVATDVGRISDHPELLGVYLASIPFMNGDAWEAVR